VVLAEPAVTLPNALAVKTARQVGGKGFNAFVRAVSVKMARKAAISFLEDMKMLPGA
jgi:hypothetical protein